MGARQSADLRRRRSLQRLAKVELQLILQLLDPISRLRAARCSRTLLAAASDPFAWAAGGVFVVRLTRTPLADVCALRRASLLRHTPVALHASAHSALSVAVAEAVPGRLHELRVVGVRPEGEVEALLAHPALEHLQSLHFDSYPPPWPAALDLAARLPQLQSLSLWCVNGEPDQLRPLRSMRALTDLTISGGAQSQLDAIGQLTQLRSLRLAKIAFGAGEALRFFSSPAMRQLRHLALGTRPAPPGVELPSDEEMRAAFGALERLESLRLARLYDVDALLAHLHHAPALRLLVVECIPQHPTVTERLVPQHPRAPALQSLLSAAPLLSVRLEGPSSLEEWLRHPNVRGFANSSGSHGESAAPLTAQWRTLQQVATELRPRVVWVQTADE